MGSSVAVTAGAAAIALLCLASANDRLIANGDRYGHVFFGGAAAGQMAEVAFAAGDLTAAFNLARRQVATAPASPSSPAMLGKAELGLGHTAQAHRALTLAGTLGWRDITTQLYWLSQAIVENDETMAMRRADALLRQQLGSPQVTTALQLFERTAIGQKVLVRLVKSHEPWVGDYLVSTGNLTGSEFAARVAIIANAAPYRSVDCHAIGQAVSILVAADRAADAGLLWQQSCGKGEDSGGPDGALPFDKIDDGGFFEWHSQPRAGVDIDPAPTVDHGTDLIVRSNATSDITVANRFIALQPGSYRLTWRTSPADVTQGLITGGVVCVGRAGNLAISGAQRDASGWQRDVQVPNDCTMQSVVITEPAAMPGQARTDRIGDIKLTRTDR